MRLKEILESLNKIKHLREDYDEDDEQYEEHELYGKYEDHEDYYFHVTSFTNAIQILKDGAIKRSDIRSDNTVCITRSERFACDHAYLKGLFFIIDKKKLLADTTPVPFDYFKNRSNPYNYYEWEDRVENMDISLAKYVVGISVSELLDEEPHMRIIYDAKDYENFVKAFNASPYSRTISKEYHISGSHNSDQIQFSGSEYYDENGDYIGVGDGNENVYWMD